MLLFVIFVITAIVLHYLSVKYQRRNWPPGPFPYPLIGNAIELYKADPDAPCVALQKLSEKYGNIFVIKAGVVDNVVVCGHKELKEAYATDELNGRFNEEWLLDRSYGSDKYGLFFSSIRFWKHNRRYAYRTLKDFGFGKMISMDDLVLEEFQELVARIKKSTAQNNGILRVELAFNAAFVNIVYSFLTGSRFSQDDPKLHELVKLTNDFFATSNIGGGALGAYPFLKNWAPEMCGFGNNHRANVKMLKYFTDLVNSFRELGDYKTNPSNFIEAVLQRIDGGPKHDDFDEPIFTDKNLICLANDFFGAGSETSANSAAFSVRRLVQNPHIQKKMQEEIDRVIGRDRWVTIADKPRLPYIEAFTFEVLRADTIVPIGPRKCNAKCKLGGYEIPAGINVLPVNYTGNNDKDVWGDPENFRPERFLNEKGEIVNTEKIVSFAFGKRDCVGQIVAKSTLFMAAAAFAQHFTFLPDPATGPPGMQWSKSMTVGPAPFNTLVKIR